MDMYLDAKSSRKISDFENKTLVELIVKLGADAENTPEAGRKKKQEAVAETIENNVRKVIIEESQANPKYYEKMSRLLDEIIQQRKLETLAYQEYLKKIMELAERVVSPTKSADYPTILTTSAQRALYDNLGSDAAMALEVDTIIHSNKLDGWRDGGIKEKRLSLAVNKVVQNEEATKELMKIIKAQSEY